MAFQKYNLYYLRNIKSVDLKYENPSEEDEKEGGVPYLWEAALMGMNESM